MEYWITRLDNVRTVLIVLLLGCIYIAGNALMAFVKSSTRSDETNYNRLYGSAVQKTESAGVRAFVRGGAPAYQAVRTDTTSMYGASAHGTTHEENSASVHIPRCHTLAMWWKKIE